MATGKYRGRVTLHIDGSRHERQFASPREAMEWFHRVNHTLSRWGIPPRSGDVVPRKGWTTLFPSRRLQYHTRRGVVVSHIDARQASDGLVTPTTWWGAVLR